MQKIKKLTPQEARKIAAGEVVERPANIVKELVENSIDAGATTISIWVKEAGKKLIRVVDNGCGMSKEDALICFEHHATSKITTVEDLSTIATFGFRGEALSSISAVSKVTLVTRAADAKEGMLVELEDCKITKQENISAAQGTDVAIKDIFYNVPARQKFLKQNDTEWRQIVNIFQALVLSYKNIHFKLFHDDKLVYNCPSCIELSDRLVQLWDHNFAQSMLKVQDKNITGLTSRQDLFRYNRGQIFFFVNNRWVRNNHLSKALLKGYLNVLPKDKFPAAFIFITIDPTHIDVNIHPRKEEVQFLNPKKIEEVIFNNVKKSLEGHLSNQIFKPAAQTTFDFEQMPFLKSVDSFGDEASNESISFDNYEKPKQNYTDSFDSLMGQQIKQTSEMPYYNPEAQDKFDKKDYELIGQFNKTYILLEKPEGLFIIDQHAAHERVLYEIFSRRFADVATTRLIFPETITLTEESINILIPYLDLLHKNGIDIEPMSKNQLVIQSTPVYLKDVSLEDLIKQFVSWIEDYESLDKSIIFKTINERLHAQMACKAAVKAGDKLTSEQIYKLIEDLNKTENRFACPHGRPTSWLLSTHEIEKKFKRKF